MVPFSNGLCHGTTAFEQEVRLVEEIEVLGQRYNHVIPISFTNFAKLHILRMCRNSFCSQRYYIYVIL